MWDVSSGNLVEERDRLMSAIHLCFTNGVRAARRLDRFFFVMLCEERGWLMIISW